MIEPAREKEHDVKREQFRLRRHEALAALAALVLVAGPPATATGQDGAQTPEELARVAVYAGGVDFTPEVAYSRAILTVTGNGKSYRYELAPGEPLAVGMLAPDGEPLADGAYKWELRLVPTAAAAKRLRVAAAAGQPVRPWPAQSGGFAIIGGRIADPALAEPQGPAADRETFTGGPVAPNPSARTPAADLDGSSATFAAAAPAPAANVAPTAASGLDDSDAVALARGPSAASTPRSDSPSPPAVVRPDPSEDGANGRSQPGKQQ